jgi:hypothetical protein
MSEYDPAVAVGWFAGQPDADARPGHVTLTEYDWPASIVAGPAAPPGLQSSLDQNFVLPLLMISVLGSAPTSRTQACEEVFVICIRSFGVDPTG